MKTKHDPLSYDQIISLLSIYESEWEHRNNLFWTQTIRFFYISIIVMFLPNIAGYLSITLPPVPSFLFPAIGIVFSTLSLFISMSYGKRVEAISKTYISTINFLPEPYRPVKIKDLLLGKYFTRRHTSVFPVILYVISAMVGIVLLFV